MDTPVEAVEVIEIGQLVDRGKIRPLNNGIKVKQPFDVVLIGANSKTLSKAVVLAE